MLKDYQDIMNILEEERIAAQNCANQSLSLMRRTLNPFKRRDMWRMFLLSKGNALGIELAIHRIQEGP